MKKIAAYFIMTIILALALCGCGNDSVDYNTDMLPDTAPAASPMVSPDNSVGSVPYTTPSVDDGVVTDKDGYIEEKDDQVKNSPVVSPEVSAKP